MSCIRASRGTVNGPYRKGRMSLAEAQAVKRFYENELNGYAYLEVE